MPYSGPASAWGVIGRANRPISRSSTTRAGSTAAKSTSSAWTTPIVHRTPSSRRAALSSRSASPLFSARSGPHQFAVRQYLNDNKIPHVFLAVAADLVGDPEHYPWTIGANPAISSEVHIYAKYILATKPNAKIGVLYQNDGDGKSSARMREGLGSANAAMIVGEASYELSEPTVDFANHHFARGRRGYADYRGDPKAAAQAIRKAYDWAGHLTGFFQWVFRDCHHAETCGSGKVKGPDYLSYFKDANDPRWKDDPGMKEWEAFAANISAQRISRMAPGFMALTPLSC